MHMDKIGKKKRDVQILEDLESQERQDPQRRTGKQELPNILAPVQARSLLSNVSG